MIEMTGSAGKRNFVNTLLLFAFSVTCVSTVFASDSDSKKHWVGTWAAAPYKAESNQPPSSLSNNTYRQMVKASLGGDTVRLNLSNITCNSPVTIQSVYIAESKGGNTIDPANMTQLKFDGEESVTIDAKSEVSSDPAAFDCKPGKWVAITIYYGQCASSEDMTFHYGSRNDSYLISGDHATDLSFNNPTVVERWYTISSLDVLAPKTAAAVAAIGNSITDGASLHEGDLEWTQVFAEELQANETTKNVGVLNLGIGATLVTSASNGAASGIDRFGHDILGQSGLHWVIIFYGVNDINAGKSANEIFNGIKQMAAAAHAKDSSIKVYGGTITPNSGQKESVRSEINNMIRTSGDLDGFIDFAEAIQDPGNPSRMQQAFEGAWGDGLHPGPKGHEALGKCIDLEMFTPPPVSVARRGNGSGPAGKKRVIALVNKCALEFDLPEESFVSLKVHSLRGEEIAELAGETLASGRHTLSMRDATTAGGRYLYSLRVGSEVVFRTTMFSGK